MAVGDNPAYKTKEQSRGFKNRLGERNGILEVIQFVKWQEEKDGKARAKWLCQCDCGKQIELDSHSVSSRQHCGCLKLPVIRVFNLTNYKYSGKPPTLNGIYSDYKARAKKYKNSWELSRELAHSLFQADCHYCGAPAYSTINPAHNGIDRVDNSLGYTVANSVCACRICNSAKKDMSVDQYKQWILASYTKQFLNNTK